MTLPPGFTVEKSDQKVVSIAKRLGVYALLEKGANRKNGYGSVVLRDGDLYRLIGRFSDFQNQRDCGWLSITCAISNPAAGVLLELSAANVTPGPDAVIMKRIPR